MIDPKTYERYASDPAAFRDDLIIDIDGIARRFGSTMDPWQRSDFAAIDPALRVCNGRSKRPGADESIRQRAYLERPRGHSKTTDLAIICCWALAFAVRPIRGYAFAADKDQAKLLKDAMATVCRLNPWLGTILEVQKDCVVNVAKGHLAEGARLDISTSDVASSYGILPDFIIADELTHWEGDGSLWHSLISSAAKRSTCLLVVITNAGFADSWQWMVRESARTDDGWHFSRLDGPQASWMTPARLAEQRRMLPAVAYARLWENQWSSGGGDALLPRDIDACFSETLQPMSGSQPGWMFVAGVDLGLTRDCSVVVVLAIPDQRFARIRLAHHKLWKPEPGNKVDLTAVETHILELDALFGLEYVAYDPWQHELLAQRLEVNSEHQRRNQRRFFWANPWLQEVTQSAANLREIAGLTIEYVGDRRLECYPCPRLRDDLLKLRAEEKSYGIRLVSPRDDTGHGDTYSAFANALFIGHDLTTKRPISAGAAEDIYARSAMQIALDRARDQADQFAQDQQRWLDSTNDYQAPFRDAMQKLRPS